MILKQSAKINVAVVLVVLLTHQQAILAETHRGHQRGNENQFSWETPCRSSSLHTGDSYEKRKCYDKKSMSPHIHNHYPPSWSVPKWLRLPSRASMNKWQGSGFGAAALSGLQAGIIVFFIIEIIRAFRDVRRELMDEASSRLDVEGTGGIPVLSHAAAENLINWINASPQEQRRYPRSVPPIMASLAQSLKQYCHNLSDRDIFGVLTRISRPEAHLLHSCMLKQTGTKELNRLQGLDHVTADISRFLRQNHILKNGRNVSPLSPYSAILQEGRRGMALWGPPGCGKSTLIKAIAHEAGLPTLIITPSLLQRKYYGESTNQVRTLFGLVAALGPCIIVLDELDGLFRSRNSEDHEAGREMKTEFLQWWDGVVSDPGRDSGVLIVGATNRPFDVDPAVWRRLHARFYIGAADWNGRYNICDEWIKYHHIPTRGKELLLRHMADHTHGYTNSDLRHVFQTACQVGPMSRDQTDPGNLELTIEDVRKALHTVSPTRFTHQYMNQLRGFLSAQDLRRSHRDAELAADSQIWQTPVGNFYQINIPVESQASDDTSDVWTKTNEKEESSDDEEHSSEEENEEVDFD
jgi:ATPase family AAA domain-containing protein 1